ncbi:DNA primase [Oceanibium sediminis]|uniref:DNA primase n=1 Tax=Oceanibium sediminis TaxID=2026339 RepID=UPI000DD4ACD1|nr:DNA primase [Oceanibium sediminis]
MALPDGFLDELRTRTSIAQVAGRKVSWDARKSNQGKGDFWASCPFHQEKSASFHVDDRKGFYYCFGCHAKGDALSFVRETENVSFMEAVEILAREAGMTMPAADPAAQKRADTRKGLAEVMELAVQWTRLQLSTAAAADARSYLERRGLTAETLARFEIGFAPNSRTAMTEHLAGKGVPLGDIVAAGLAIKPDDGGAPYDRFRGRIMFPIRDARGRAIAFGGRAMDPNARAKYLNSPETPLFDKGRALYNIALAREAAGKAQALVVAEGYMDVIALSQAGIGHAVAPLGTAITPDQIQMMWRISDEPVIALDGDTAGLRAAQRTIDTALPLLEPGKALRFCLMPEGLDPDDLIRAQGAGAMREMLEGAVPMVDLLWRRETEGQVFDSPERRAALDKRLHTAIAQIRDPGLQGHYKEAIRELRYNLFRPAQRSYGQPRFTPGGKGGKGGKGFGARGAPAGPLPATRSSLLARAATTSDEVSEARVRESAILLGCFNHLSVARAAEPDLERAHFLCADLDGLRRLLLRLLDEPLSEAGNPAHGEAGQNESGAQGPRAPLRAAAKAQTGEDPAIGLLKIGQLRDNPYLSEDASENDAAAAVKLELARQMAETGMAAELRDAEEEITGVADEGLTWRLTQASAARDASRKATPGGENELKDESDLSRQLQKLIDQQIWLRRSR